MACRQSSRLTRCERCAQRYNAERNEDRIPRIFWSKAHTCFHEVVGPHESPIFFNLRNAGNEKEARAHTSIQSRADASHPSRRRSSSTLQSLAKLSSRQERRTGRTTEQLWEEHGMM